MSREATERLLQNNSLTRLEPDEKVIVWSRAWVSKAGRLQRLAPRWRDVAVVTDRRLLLFGVGHFTRRPRRRVLADRLDELTLSDVGAQAGRGLRCSRPGRSPMLLELGTDPWSRRLVQELQDRTGEPALEPATLLPSTALSSTALSSAEVEIPAVEVAPDSAPGSAPEPAGDEPPPPPDS
jgi:hypothetical protein